MLLGLVCAAGAVQAAPLTDSTGRTVEVTAPVATVVPAGAPAQILLQAIAPDRLGGLVEAFPPEHAIYVDETVARRPQIPMLSRTDAPGDVAAVAALKPGLVVDYGSLSPRYVAATEKIGKELGVPAVLFSGDLADVPHVARELGAALDPADRAEAVATAAQAVLDRLKPLAGLPDAERVPVYMARGPDGLSAVRAGGAFDEALRLAGGRNVVENRGGGMLRTLSVDEVVAAAPKVVVVADRDALHSPLHDKLPAGTVWVLDTGEPYKVLLGPPSLNRLIGAAALAAILHPDRPGYEPDDLRRIATTLFPIPPGLAMPLPLQVQP